MRVRYWSSNSGGDWWLDDKDWAALEAAGWIVHWYHDPQDDHGDYPGKGEEGDPHLWGASNWYHSHAYGVCVQVASVSNGERWLGALAGAALSPEVPTLRAAIDAWRSIVGRDPSDEGCRCCGAPHSFMTDGPEGVYVSGADIEEVD